MVVVAAEKRSEFRVAANGAFDVFLHGREFMLWVANIINMDGKTIGAESFGNTKK